MSGRRLNFRRFHGPYFPSYQTAALNTTDAQKRQWLAHNSTRAQLRHLRQKCRAVLDSRDPAIQAIGARILDAVQGEPNPEFGALHLIAAALDASADTGETWLTSMTYVLDKFQEMERDQ